MKKLEKDFYLDEVTAVARKLVGCFLVRQTEGGRIIGRINEVEAYDGRLDKACHAYGHKRTKRNEPLFQKGGLAHVYLIYGRYYCLNVVTGNAGEPAAVLIRGAEILEGRELAAGNRYRQSWAELTDRQMKHLADGPGKLCLAMAVDKSFDFEPLDGRRLYVCREIGRFTRSVAGLKAHRRIGIEYAEEARDFLWRFTG